MIDEALDAAEAFRQREQVATFEEAARIAQVAFNKECDDAAESRHLARGQFVLRMRSQSRVNDPLDFVMPFQPFGDTLGIATMALHADVERL